MKHIVKGVRSIFRKKVSNDRPAVVAQMKRNLDDTKKKVKVKVCKYPVDQEKLFDAYFNELVKMALLKVCPTASWQAAPHLVPKDARTKYRTTIDLLPVNAATEAELRPMPIIGAELSAFKGSSHFVSLDFCSSY